MSVSTPVPVRDDAPPPPAHLLGALRSGDVVRRMLSAFVAEIPFYRRLPQEQLEHEIAQVCRANIADFVRCCREGRLPASGELTAARAGAARRAEEGVPLDAVLSAYMTGNRITWQVLAEQAGDADDVVAFTPYVQRYLQAMLQAVTDGYVEERRAIEQDTGSSWHELVQRLVEGEPAHGLAAQLGVVLSDSYLVLALHVGPTDDERSSVVDADVAARRKTRRLHSAVDRLPGRAATLAQLVPAGGVVLMPGVARQLPGRAETLRTLTLLADAAGAPATAVAVPAPALTSVPEAVAHAAELLDLALALGRPPGLYALDDLLLEQQFARSGPARQRLADLLRPLADHPDLLPTARAWLLHERSRRDTAEALHVHPNTLDKRLERLAALTGIDVGTTRGLAVLQAALVALEVEDVDTRGLAP